MKCKIPEISWHNRDPVLSVDIQSKKVDNPDIYRLASGGTDAHVLIWYLSLTSDGSEINLDLAADLTRHQKAVNVVKWSPNGELLASGDDESVIFIWKQKTEADPPNLLENTQEQDKEIWLSLKVLRGHMEDVYDLSWAPSSQYLVSGSVDNSAIIWDVHKGKSVAILSDHKGFVQGVAWDPSNQYVATLSTDRYLRIFDIQTKRVVQRINKSVLNVPDGHALHGRRMRLFHDDTLQTFFRRLCFTPDGKLLLTPAGVTDFEGCTKPLHTTYGFSRYSFRQPALILPCPDQYTVAVSCCPLLFNLRPYNENNPPVVPLPYRMIFAVATRSSVYFYDTQQRQPFAVISNIHYTRLTDLTWSNDGRVVVVSSTDGFCSLITFESGELGVEYEKMDEVLNAVLLPNDTTAPNNKKSKKQKENELQESKSRKPSVDETMLKPKVVTLQDSTLKQVKEQDRDQESKPKNENNENKLEGQKSNLPTLPTTTAVKPLLAADIILDKEILSSDEKFESPEKKSRSATPIMVRRHPRTPSSATAKPIDEPKTPSMTVDPKMNASIDSPLTSLKTTPSQQVQVKQAKPIAVRIARAIISEAPKSINSPTVVEEAMDAWPIQISPSPPSEEKASSSTTPASAINNSLALNEAEDRTEDIRLVYEDTVEENALTDMHSQDIEKLPTKSDEAELTQHKNVVSNDILNVSRNETECKANPNQKTPRRVQLKTISTPKSKKTLL